MTDRTFLDDRRELRAVVFDFDGLIIDTESTALRSWQELYERFGQTVPVGKWIQLIGTWDALWDPRAELEMLVGHALDWEALELERRARERELADQLPMLPGVLPLLEEARARELRLAIASSSSEEWVRHHLDRLGIAGYFDALATRHDVARTKPDPALYRLALERLGVTAGEAIAFEDSLNGVIAAKGAGLQVIAVPGTLMEGQDFSAAEALLTSLEGISLGGLAARLGLGR